MNDYYVYGHYRQSDNILFYIGKGKNKRKDSKQFRPKSWHEFTKDNKWYSDIIKDNLSEDDALSLEIKLISENIENLTNQSIPRPVKQIPDFSELFQYSEDSPSGLIWKNDNIGSNGRVYNKAGTLVGSVKVSECGKHKCWRVVVDDKRYYIHRIVYSMFNELPSNLVVDHIDGNALNNKIENLRAITQEQNSRNMSKSSANPLGVVGVTFKIKNKGTRSYRIYTAIYKLNGKNVSKEFFVSKYGEQEAFRLACEWRKQKIEELNAQGAGYTERHGT